MPARLHRESTCKDQRDDDKDKIKTLFHFHSPLHALFCITLCYLTDSTMFQRKIGFL
jgi:hypothetical protein